MKNISSSRIGYIDIAKGLGMLAVIWGHTLLSGYTNLLVYSFHIPLFFFLSGLVYKKERYSSLSSLVKSRAKGLLIPYAIFSVLTWIFWVTYNYAFGLNPESYINPLLQTIIAQGSGSFMKHNAPLWFVTCLFMVEIFYYFIAKTKWHTNILICLFLAVIGHFMLYNNIINFNFKLLPWNLEVVMSAMLFYSAGNLFVNKFGLKYLPDFLKERKVATLFIMLASTVILCVGSYFNGVVTLGSNRLGNNTVAFYFIAFCGIISTLIASAFLEKYSNCFFNFLKWIGKNSFYFMAVHVPVGGFVCVVFSRLTHISTSVIDNSLPFSSIVFIITTIASAIAVIIINKFLDFIKTKKQ